MRPASALAATTCLALAAGCGGDRKPAPSRTPAPSVNAELKTARGMSVRISARHSGGKICTVQVIRVPSEGGYSEVRNRFCEKPGTPGTVVKATVLGRPAAQDGETVVYDSPERCRLWRNTDARTSCSGGDPPVRLTLISGRRPTTLDDGHTRLELPAFSCQTDRPACTKDIR
jgi:hypothetical protein